MCEREWIPFVKGKNGREREKKWREKKNEERERKMGEARLTFYSFRSSEAGAKFNDHKRKSSSSR